MGHPGGCALSDLLYGSEAPRDGLVIVECSRCGRQWFLVHARGRWTWDTAGPPTCVETGTEEAY